MAYVALLFFVVLPVLLLGGGVVVAVYSILRWRRLGRAQDLRTANEGVVVFTGKAEPHDLALVSPITRRPCVWYHVDVEIRTGVAKYESIKKVGSGTPFDLVAADGTRVEVDVSKLWLANEEVARSKTKQKGAPAHVVESAPTRWHKITEQIIPADAVVTALGRVTKNAGGYRSGGPPGGYRARTIDTPVIGDPDGKLETVVAIGERGALKSALVKHVTMGVGLFLAGAVWGGGAIWLLATH